MLQAAKAYGTGNRVGAAGQTKSEAYSALTQGAKPSQATTFGNIMTTILPYLLYDQTSASSTVLE